MASSELYQEALGPVVCRSTPEFIMSILDWLSLQRPGKYPTASTLLETVRGFQTDPRAFCKLPQSPVSVWVGGREVRTFPKYAYVGRPLDRLHQDFWAESAEMESGRKNCCPSAGKQDTGGSTAVPSCALLLGVQLDAGRLLCDQTLPTPAPKALPDETPEQAARRAAVTLLHAARDPGWGASQAEWDNMRAALAGPLRLALLRSQKSLKKGQLDLPSSLEILFAGVPQVAFWSTVAYSCGCQEPRTLLWDAGSASGARARVLADRPPWVDGGPGGGRSLQEVLRKCYAPHEDADAPGCTQCRGGCQRHVVVLDRLPFRFIVGDGLPADVLARDPLANISLPYINRDGLWRTVQYRPWAFISCRGGRYHVRVVRRTEAGPTLVDFSETKKGKPDGDLPWSRVEAADMQTPHSPPRLCMVVLEMWRADVGEGDTMTELESEEDNGGGSGT